MIHVKMARLFFPLPIQDEATPSPFMEDFSAAIGTSEGEGAASALPDHIYMDAMGFGMGCSCLQMTFQVSRD